MLNSIIMELKQIILFGANGMLGNYIRSYFGSIVVSITRSDFNILDATLDNIRDLFSKYHVDNQTLIFNAAGLIPSAKKNGISTSKIDYIKINGEFPVLLAQISNNFGAKMIHPATDCVYNGLSNGFYTEEDMPTEINDYGRSKAMGDMADCTVIRTSIIGEEVRNKRSLIEWVKSNEGMTINGYTNHMWNGITCLQYAKIVDQIIEKDLFWNGVRHIKCPQSYSKYEIVKMVNEVYDLNIEVIPIKTNTTCNKTLDSIFSIVLDIPDLKDQIREQKEFNLEE